MERWRPVVAFEGIYEVSDLARVRRVKGGRGAKPGTLLTPYDNGNGYAAVKLGRDNKKSKWFVHRLVAAAFIGPCPEGCEVNHIDSNPSNNELHNLEYVTRSGNNLHSYRSGRAPTTDAAIRTRCKLSETDVARIRYLYQSYGHTQSHLARMFGVTRHAVHRIVHGVTWKTVTQSG